MERLSKRPAFLGILTIMLPIIVLIQPHMPFSYRKERKKGFYQPLNRLVDLVGSERVDRSEVTRDRLKETQHINKSLYALGDVIYALAQKNAHIPYKNSKLTQVLQASLGDSTSHFYLYPFRRYRASIVCIECCYKSSVESFHLAGIIVLSAIAIDVGTLEHFSGINLVRSAALAVQILRSKRSHAYSASIAKARTFEVLANTRTLGWICWGMIIQGLFSKV